MQTVQGRVYEDLSCGRRDREETEMRSYKAERHQGQVTGRGGGVTMTGMRDAREVEDFNLRCMESEVGAHQDEGPLIRLSEAGDTSF